MGGEPKPIIAAALMKSPTRDAWSRTAGAAVGIRLSSGPGIIYFMTPIATNSSICSCLWSEGAADQDFYWCLVLPTHFPVGTFFSVTSQSDNMSSYPGQLCSRSPLRSPRPGFPLLAAHPVFLLQPRLLRALYDSKVSRCEAQGPISRFATLNSWTLTSEKSCSRASARASSRSCDAALGRCHAPRHRRRPAVVTIVS